MADTIDIFLREFRRYATDGLPNPPTQDAPTGDPQSGVFNPTKADLRTVLRYVLDAHNPIDDGAGFDEDVPRSILSRAPAVFTQIGGDYAATPADHPYFNVAIGHGSGASLTGEIWRSTFIGAMAGRFLEVSERSEAIGQGAMQFARFAQRDTAVGTLVMQWLGQQQADLAAYFHDLWYPVLPTSPAWDVDGMETNVPGSKAAIIAVTDAVSSDDVARNVGVGRNALLHIVKGTNNVGVGYQALTHLYNGSNNTAVGTEALRNNLFGQNNAALGTSAGYGHQQGDSNIYIGFEAGLTHYTGDRSIFIGRLAGQGWTAASRSIVIGSFAGTTTTPGDDLLVIANTEAREPLIAGKFALGHVGINVSPEDMLGCVLHVRGTSAGFTGTINTGADALVLEGSAAQGLSIISPTSGNIIVGKEGAPSAGGLTYTHSTNRWVMNVNSANGWTFGAGYLRTHTALPTSAGGLTSGQIWSNAGVLTVVP
jgi:hypothetical protein